MLRPLIALTAVLLLAGCAHVSTVAPGLPIILDETEYRIAPQDVQAKAGELAIEVYNYGRLTHNLAVRQGSRTVASTKPIPPASSAELLVDLSAGSYQLVSTLFSDQDLGLYGTLDVTR